MSGKKGMKHYPVETKSNRTRDHRVDRSSRCEGKGSETHDPIL